jgi:hypothetical protein
VAPSSSARKVARLASRGKGKKVRFQGGSIFPIAVGLVVVLGLLAIVYGRQSRPTDGSGAPGINDHWHAAFGVYVCDTFQPKVIGTKEESGTDSAGNQVLLNEKFSLTGIHSHEDGIIHYHPSSTRSTGNRAKLGVFLDVYDIKLTDTELVMPADQGGETWSTKDTKCDGKDTELKVVVWDSFDNKTVSHDVVTDFNNIRIVKDAMVFVIAFVPKGTSVPQPDWADELPTLGQADGGAVIATTTSVAGGPTTSAVATGDTTVGGSSAPTTELVATATTVPAPAATGG